MSTSTYFKPNIHQNGPEILGASLHTFMHKYGLLKNLAEICTN
jgi:hypothetical protein